MSEALYKAIRDAALENAVKFGGKANPKALVGKIVGQFSEQKSRMGELMKEIAEITEEVNALDPQKQQEALDETGFVKQEKKKIDPMKDLENAKTGNVVMRFAPSASGPMHIGHAFTGGLSSLYVKKYGGKLILRIEDTNSDNIDPAAYDALVRDGNWIFGNIGEVVIQSDRLEIYYKYARSLFGKGTLYVCTCTPEAFKEVVTQQIPCQCRAASIPDQEKRFERMFDKYEGFKEGEAVVRIKADMAHKNPAMRDFPLLRINDSQHPRVGKKFRVWPLMNFAVLVDDIELGISHVIRGKDHADNARRQELLYKALEVTPPVSYFTGKYKFEGMDLSTSQTRESISTGQYEGWADIRLPFLIPLKRRGYQAGALLEYARMNGLSQVDKVIPKDEFFKTLDAFNKDIIDPVATRHFFVHQPQALTIDCVKEVELALHPDMKTHGGRKFTVANSVLVEKEDVDPAALIRLMDFCNISYDGGTWKVHSESYEDFKAHTGVKKIIHWLPDDAQQLQKVTVRMPDNSVVTGFGESQVLNKELGDVIQFERFGFCRLDSIKDGAYNFWYGHN
ncbi:MAG: glutamyl-tRNA synthetase [Candidatus Woesearchaeota archaeon]|jgi:glutamyl-tRNA synthetase